MHRFAILVVLFVTHSVSLAQEPADTNYDESKVPKFELPNPLVSPSGKIIGRNEWKEYRRAEVLGLFEETVYGKTPDRVLDVRFEILESDPKALGGIATRKQVALFFGDEEYRLDLLIYLPNDREGPAPGFLGLNFQGNHTVHTDPKIIKRESSNQRGELAERWQVETIVKNGFAIATVHRDQIDPDNYRHDFSDGIHPLFYEKGQTKPEESEWGAIGAWAWGLSRALDYLETVPEIDASRIAVIGHSRLGKTALWAGAQDERFAMIISNNSGCGGAALYRRCYGERIHHMIKPVGYWFCDNHKKFAKKEQELPVDQHMLMALIAPRPLYVASATEDRWADPKGEFLAAKHACAVYELFDKPTLSGKSQPKPDQPIHSTVGYHLRTGKHGVTAYDWDQYLKFADRHLK